MSSDDGGTTNKPLRKRAASEDDESDEVRSRSSIEEAVSSEVDSDSSDVNPGGEPTDDDLPDDPTHKPSKKHGAARRTSSKAPRRQVKKRKVQRNKSSVGDIVGAVIDLATGHDDEDDDDEEGASARASGNGDGDNEVDVANEVVEDSANGAFPGSTLADKIQYWAPHLKPRPSGHRKPLLDPHDPQSFKVINVGAGINEGQNSKPHDAKSHRRQFQKYLTKSLQDRAKQCKGTDTRKFSRRAARQLMKLFNDEAIKTMVDNIYKGTKRNSAAAFGRKEFKLDGLLDMASPTKEDLQKWGVYIFIVKLRDGSLWLYIGTLDTNSLFHRTQILADPRFGTQARARPWT